MNRRVVRRDIGGELNQSGGQSVIHFACTFGRWFRSAAQPGDLRRESRSCGWLQVRGIAVVPTAVEPPDVADDELGLLVHGPKERPLQRVLGNVHGLEHLVERSAAVHCVEGMGVQLVQQLGAVEQGAANASLAGDGQAVPGQQQLRAQLGHPAERIGPFAGEPLDTSAGCRRSVTPR